MLTFNTQKHTWLHAALLSLALLLAGCGGGGGSDGPSDTGDSATDTGDDSGSGSGGDSGDTTGGGDSSDGGGLSPIGKLDTTFGSDADGDGTSDGWVLHTGPSLYEAFDPEDAVRDASGRIIVTGSVGDRMALWRLNPDGSLDASFGEDYDGDGTPDGYWKAPDASEPSRGNSVTLAGSGQYILVTGKAEADFTTYARVWRHHAGNGLPDNSFGATLATPGKGFIDLSDPDSDGDGNPDGKAEGKDIIEDNIGRIVVVGHGTSGFNYNMVVWRLTAFFGFWGLDTLSFGTAGVFQDGGSASGDEMAMAVAEDASGNLVVAGYKYNEWAEGSMQDMAVWRLTDSGTLDTTFGVDYDGDGTPDGLFIHHNAAGGGGGDQANSITIDSSGNILLAGRSASSVILSSDAVIWRLTPDGVLDNAFNSGFRTLRSPSGITQGISSVVEDPDGNILATGFRGLVLSQLVTWRLDGTGGIIGESVFNIDDHIDKYMGGRSVFPETGGGVTVVANVAIKNDGLLVVRYRP